MMNERSLRAMLEPLRRRVMMTIGRAVLRAIDDGSARQRVQVEAMKDELIDGVERMQNYGFSSVPFAGADACLVFVAGNREQGIAIVVDDRRYRLTSLEPGEVAIYDDQGQAVHLTRDGIVVNGGSLPVTITNTPLTAIESNVAITGDVAITGNMAATGEVSDALGSMNEMRGVYNGHQHTGGGNPPIQQMT